MAAYIGQIVTLTLMSNGGQFCGKLVSQDYQTGRLTLTKVTCLTTNKKLPGNQIYYHDEIVPDSIVIVDESGSSMTSVGNKELKTKPSKTLLKTGSKCRTTAPVRCDIPRETFELGSLHQYLQDADDPDSLPDNVVTANIYTQVESLAPREEWSKREPCVRPSSYIVIDSLGETFDEAIVRIMSEDSVGVAVTGMNVGRHGQLCWIQVGASDIVYMFDAFTMGHKCISFGLDRLFTSTTLLKVIHDCRWLSDLLYHQYHIKLVNVFDTQASAILVYRVQNGGDLPAYVTSMQQLVETYLPIHPDEYHVYKIRQIYKETEEKIWSSRPMHSHLLDSLAKGASYLRELREPLVRALMRDFYIAVDSYVSCVRDMPDDIYTTSLPEKHTIPEVFTRMFHRDRRSSVVHRFHDKENRVNSQTGCVENSTQVKEYHYRRDAISHGRALKRDSNSSNNSYSNERGKSSVTVQKKPSANRYVVPRGVTDLSSSGEADSSEKPPAATTASSLSESPKLPQTTSSPGRATSSIQAAADSDHRLLMTGVDDVESGVPINSEWSPQTQDVMHTLAMKGMPNQYKKVSVGRGRSRLKPQTISDDQLFTPKKTSAQKTALSALRSSAAAHDSDSGVDSSSPARQQRVSAALSVSAMGYQNYELMGNASLSLDELPESFDLRSASANDLRMLKRNKSVKSAATTAATPAVLPAASEVMPDGVEVRRLIHRRDGTVEDARTGLKTSSGHAEHTTCDLLSDQEEWDD